MVTGDGILQGLSAKAETHPRFGTDFYEGLVHIPLPPTQERLANMLLEAKGELGRTCPALRSTLGQLGVEGMGDEDNLQIKVIPKTGEGSRGEECKTHLEVLTRFSAWNEQGEEAIDALRTALPTHELHVAWAGLLPHAAKVGSMQMHLRPVEFSIDFTRFGGREQLLRILDGKVSARGSLEHSRMRIRDELRMLESGGFFLGEFDVDHVLDEIILIEPTTHVGDRETGVVHGGARLFHPDREERLRRQLEVKNRNGRAESLEGLVFTGIAYRPCTSV